MKYQNRKNGKVAEVVRVNEKFKTLTLRFIDDGKERDYSSSTIGKSWKKLPDEPKEEPKVDVVTEKPVKKVGRKHREISSTVMDLLGCVDSAMKCLGGSVRIPRDETMKFRALCNADGRQVCKLMWSANKIRLYFRADIVCEAYTDFIKVNYSLPYLYEIYEYTDATAEKIKNLLILAVNNDHRKTKNKKED